MADIQYRSASFAGLECCRDRSLPTHVASIISYGLKAVHWALDDIVVQRVVKVKHEVRRLGSMAFNFGQTVFRMSTSLLSVLDPDLFCLVF